MATRKPRTPKGTPPSTAVVQALGKTKRQDISGFVHDAMFEYGSYVIENRAIPSGYDGLKPVQRCILWSSYKLGLTHTKGFRKAARTVGDCIGKYHPHGDCLRGDTVVPLINGEFYTLKELCETEAGELRVAALDEATGELIHATAHSWRVGQYSKLWYKITLSTGEHIEATGNHPFYLNGVWTKTEDLKVGDAILASDLLKALLGELKITSIEVIQVEEAEPFYDFTVDGYENMAVLTSDGVRTGNFVIAHNSSVFSAMVGISGTRRQGKDKGWFVRNAPIPLIEGQGNWGDFNEEAAAMRYVEARLSQFSCEVLLDPDYLAVSDYIDNYDASDKLPLVLPAKLPLLLLNGYSAIGVGISASGPAFSLKSILPYVDKALQGKPLDLKSLCTTLVFDPPYGGECLASPKEMIPIIKRGKGSAYFAPSYELNEPKRILTFTSVCPGLASQGTVNTFLENVSKIRGVAHIDDESGSHGTRLTVTFGRSLTEAAFQAALDECLNKSIRSDNFDLGVSIRQLDGPPKFKRSSVIQVLEDWAVWRTALELKVINRLLSIEEQTLLKQQTLVIAVDNLETIIKALRIKKEMEMVKVGNVQKEVDASAAYLMRSLKLSLDQAEMILDMKVRSLRSLEKDKVLLKIKDTEKEIKILRVDQKAPDKRAIKGLHELNFDYF